MSKEPRKVDRLYEVKGTLRLMSKALLFVPRVYVQGVKSIVPVTQGALMSLRRKEPVVQVTRPTRNYDRSALAMAKAIMPYHYIETIKQVGIGANDEIMMHYLRAIPVALVSQDFEPIYDGMLGDERLTDDEKDLIASATLDAQAMELSLL